MARDITDETARRLKARHPRRQYASRGCNTQNSCLHAHDLSAWCLRPSHFCGTRMNPEHFRRGTSLYRRCYGGPRPRLHTSTASARVLGQDGTPTRDGMSLPFTPKAKLMDFPATKPILPLDIHRLVLNPPGHQQGLRDCYPTSPSHDLGDSAFDALYSRTLPAATSLHMRRSSTRNLPSPSLLDALLVRVL